MKLPLPSNLTQSPLVLKTAGVAVVLVCFMVAWIWMGINSFSDQNLNVSEPTVYFIEPGSSLIMVARDLEKQEIITNARYFVWLARLQGVANDIKVGEYDLTAQKTAANLLDDFVNGRVKQYVITIVEGWTFKQMLEAIKDHPNITHTLEKYDNESVMAAIGHPDEHPEGRFLPDTYHFPKGTTDVDVLKRAYDEMEQTVARLWPERAPSLPYDTPYEAQIMASIVEKETAIAGERTAIAGVFVRRLQSRMRLQTDPTVIYGMGDRYKGNIRKRDLKRDTPYNTYTRHGLPPTPIALPGADAIEAALNPAPGEALYFVAKGDGSHHFSKTIEEHNRAVRKYQIRNRKKNYKSTPLSTSSN
jgi:UPF0755 protein